VSAVAPLGANSGSTEEVLAAFFYGREDIIPGMFNLMATVMAPWGVSCSKI
jgi:hypothetical protein